MRRQTKLESLLRTAELPGNLLRKTRLQYTVVLDGMCVIDVGLQMTLQSHHIVLGHQLAQHPNHLGLGRNEDNALIFLVPTERFGVWNQRNLSWKDEAVVGKVVA